MRKMISILCIPTALLSACSPSGMQGNPAAVQAGAAIGGVLGAIVGDRGRRIQRFAIRRPAGNCNGGLLWEMP